jgi:hypothetical protein
MAYTLLHLNEFTYLVHSGSIHLSSDRFFNESEGKNGVDIFRSVGYLKYSSPESYMLGRVNDALLRFRPKSSSGLDVIVGINAFQEFIPITQQAEVLLRPIIDRAYLRVSAPRFESAWQRFVDEEILRERREAALEFTRLFSCEDLVKPDWEPVSGLQQFIIKDLGNSFNEIERLKESSELGVFEFCVRLAKEHDESWIKNPAYQLLKKVRKEELSDKKLARFSFFESKKVCVILREFEEESIDFFGYTPFCLVPFFEFYRSHSKASGINYDEIRRTISNLLRFQRVDDAINFVHIVGYSLGLEEVIPARYFICRESPALFDTSGSSFPTKERLAIELPLEFDDLFAVLNDSEELDGVDIQGVEDSNSEVVPPRSEVKSSEDLSKGSIGDSSESTAITASSSSAIEVIQEGISSGTQGVDSVENLPLVAVSAPETPGVSGNDLLDNASASLRAPIQASIEAVESGSNSILGEVPALQLGDADANKSDQSGSKPRTKKKSP